MRANTYRGGLSRWATWLVLPLGLLLAYAPLGGIAAAHSSVSSRAAVASQNPFCSRLGHSIQASAGAQMWCFGSQPNGAGAGASAGTNSTISTNVDAANPHEDVSPAGVQAYGQSEESVAAVGSYVVEAWNDATGFLSACPSPMNKEEGTGYGFSANGGASFIDEGGFPNSACATNLYLGDPSVEGWRSGGAAYFYISSLYPSATGVGNNFLALAACKATGTGSSAKISCGQPVIIAESTSCVTMNGFTFCSFLDKEYLSIDPVHKRLYVSYTDFGVTGGSNIDLAVCDLSSPGTPVCNPGTHPTAYYTLASTTTCESEGAYPAADPNTGDVYVAWEYNWATNLFMPSCFAVPTQNIVARVPFSCLTLTTTSPCATTAPAMNAVNVTSMDAAFIPGYNRFPMNDFPRIAVSHAAGTVSIVWNDARSHPFGDILLQSFALGSLAKVQTSPVRVNTSTAGWHMLPALRYPDDDGDLQIGFYQRSSANTALTDVYAALDVNARTTTTPGSNVKVTTVASDWNAVSSDIVPNFGDYTDIYVLRTGSSSTVNDRVYVAWADGRLGVPQPFEAHTLSS